MLASDELLSEFSLYLTRAFGARCHRGMQPLMLSNPPVQTCRLDNRLMLAALAYIALNRSHEVRPPAPMPDPRHAVLEPAPHAAP